MLIYIAPKATVFVSHSDLDFIKTHSKKTFRASELTETDQQIAKRLADKSIFVRKKLDNDVQYLLNRYITKSLRTLLMHEHNEYSKKHSTSHGLEKRK